MIYALTALSCPRCGIHGKLNYLPDTYKIPVYKCTNSGCGLISTVSNVKTYNGLSDDDSIASVTVTKTESDSNISLSWTLNNITQASAEIFRSETNDYSAASSIGTISDTTTSYDDATAVNDTTYYYWVYVTDSDSNTFHSLSIEATATA